MGHGKGIRLLVNFSLRHVNSKQGKVLDDEVVYVEKREGKKSEHKSRNENHGLAEERLARQSGFVCACL